ncbi:MAG TPA: hypothetical protein VGI59_04755, partial [Candidatus Udaeobacter sp.]
CWEKRVTIVSPNVGRIALDNFTVLRYEKTARVAIRDSKFGIASRLPVYASHFTLHNSNPLNEILHYFSCKSLSWSNFDTLAY